MTINVWLVDLLISKLSFSEVDACVYSSHPLSLKGKEAYILECQIQESHSIQILSLSLTKHSLIGHWLVGAWLSKKFLYFSPAGICLFISDKCMLICKLRRTNGNLQGVAFSSASILCASASGISGYFLQRRMVLNGQRQELLNRCSLGTIINNAHLCWTLIFFLLVHSTLQTRMDSHV